VKEMAMRRAIAAVWWRGWWDSPNVDRVLTNVVVRDKKTGALIKGLKQSDFRYSKTRSRRRSPASTTRTWMRRYAGEKATVSGTSTTKKKTIADLVNNNFAASRRS
jgi:hypothetical protein